MRSRVKRTSFASRNGVECATTSLVKRIPEALYLVVAMREIVGRADGVRGVSASATIPGNRVSSARITRDDTKKMSLYTDAQLAAD
jgi:hypothetical protein